MTSRAELIQIMRELGIEYDGLSIEEMDRAVREEIDRQFDINIKIGNKGKSVTLLRFMNEEYDYVFKNEEGKLVNYKGEEI